MTKNIRKFFSDLSWGGEVGQACLVFTKNEVEHIPLKYLKHLLLVYTGLRSISSLNNEVLRFPMTLDGLAMAQHACSALLTSFQGTSKSALVVLKMVFSTITMGLPNYRVTAMEQVAPAFAEIEKVYLGKSDEIWLCLSNVSFSDSNLGGRFAFRLDPLYIPEIIEIVWFTSPRMLDNYRIGNYPYPYIKASRLPGQLSFSIDDEFIPQEFSNSIVDIENKVLQDYHFVLHQLELRKEPITNLCEILRLSHVREVVLEFKVDSGHFRFIDWDTDAEAEVIW